MLIAQVAGFCDIINRACNELLAPYITCKFLREKAGSTHLTLVGFMTVKLGPAGR